MKRRPIGSRIARCFFGIVPCLLVAGWASADDALTPKQQLGKELFFDKISDPPWVSCATCHAPAAGWTGAIAGINLHGAVYRGAVPQRFGDRKPPSSAYATFSPVLGPDSASGEFVGGNFWDGRATGEKLGNPAADQALGPFLNPLEQNMPSPQAVCEHVAASKYADLFEEVWGPGTLDCSAEGVADMYDKIGLSIAAYEDSSEVNQFSSKFDAYWRACLEAGNDPEDCGLAEGEKAVLDPLGILTESEFLGLIEFGEYCSPCHVSHEAGPDGVPPLFTDFTYHNIGVPRNPENPFYRNDEFNPLGEDWVDLGLGGFLRSRPEWADLADANDGKHKVPTVRNVDKRIGHGFPKAYMHNGVFKSLKEVVHFYNTRDVPEENWPPPEVDRNVNRDILEGVPLGNLELDEEAEDNIVAFLATLSDGFMDRGPGPDGNAGATRPAFPQLLFVRADANNDGAINIADPIATLNFLFRGTGEPPCLDAADTNDDGRVDVSDAVASVSVLFLGARLPVPQGGCTDDTTRDSLGCESLTFCNGA